MCNGLYTLDELDELDELESFRIHESFLISWVLARPRSANPESQGNVDELSCPWYFHIFIFMSVFSEGLWEWWDSISEMEEMIAIGLRPGAAGGKWKIIIKGN